MEKPINDPLVHLMHFRGTKSERKIIKQACAIAGVKCASKARELMVDWAYNTIAERRALDG